VERNTRLAFFAAFANINEVIELTNIGTLFAFVLVAVGVMALRGPLTGLSIPPRLRAVARLALVALLPVAVVALLIALGLLRVYP